MTGCWVTAKELQRRVQETHCGIITLDESTFVNMGTKARFIDVEFGDWWAKPANVINKKSTCPHRARIKNAILLRNNSIKLASRPVTERRVLSIEIIKQRLLNALDNLVVIDEKTYINVFSKARFIDVEFGEFWGVPRDVIRFKSGHQKRNKIFSHKKRILSLQIIKTKLLAKHGDQVTIDESTYDGSRKKAKFIDKDYGEWWATPTNVAKYGTSHPRRSLSKRVVASYKRCLIPHWKTGNLCAAHGGYELATLIWLNLNQIDYDWQIPMVTNILTPKGKCSIYNVDLFVKDGKFKNTWIEIKGTWNRKNGHVGKLKWEWLNKNYPNSQLWMKSELEQLGILSK